MQLKITLDGQPHTATLTESVAARAFAAQLPLSLALQDYADTEKIATLPTRLPPEPGAAHTGAPGDITYYAPWGNLALFYGHGPRAPAGLVYLGRLDGDFSTLRRATRITLERMDEKVE